MNPEYLQNSGFTLTAKEHRCTVYCNISHEFGNIYRCHTSGRRHVCDATCDQKRMVGKDYTRCLLSGKVYPAPKELLSRLRRKRCTDDLSMEEPAHKRGSFFDGRHAGPNGRLSPHLVAFVSPDESLQM